jgi:hypothetical protein
MTRKEEIIQTARQKEKEVGFSQFVHEARGVNSAYGIGFLEGAEWADNHSNLTWEDIRKICIIAKNVHKYYGFWTQIVYEEILDRFCKPEIWT